MASPLDNPAWWALTGPQQHLGTVQGAAARFDPLISPFGALADIRDKDAWADLLALTGPGGTVALVTPDLNGGEPGLAPGPGWSKEWEFELPEKEDPFSFSGRFDPPAGKRSGDFELAVSAAGVPLVRRTVHARRSLIPRRPTSDIQVCA